MKLLVFLFSFFILQQVPFKASEDFDLKLEYQFKQRPAPEKTSVHFDETRKEHERRTSTAMLPYLMIRVNLLKVSQEEVRVKITNNRERSTSKKVEEGSSLLLDLGFTDDIKDRVSPHEYNLMFVSAEKKELSRIHLLIEEDGTFLVNGEKRGKF
jgi:hypothetical protein